MCAHAGRISNIYYTKDIPIPRKDSSEDNSNSDTTMNNSNNERDGPSDCDYLKSVAFQSRRCHYKLIVHTPVLLFRVKKYGHHESLAILRSLCACTKWSFGIGDQLGLFADQKLPSWLPRIFFSERKFGPESLPCLHAYILVHQSVLPCQVIPTKSILVSMTLPSFCAYAPVTISYRYHAQIYNVNQYKYL